uniref:Uncharacterized protein n=1 Tax=Leptobrachium leishanense TaxID=445787 RepID=A0A8C5QQL3_9ANUR
QPEYSGFPQTSEIQRTMLRAHGGIRGSFWQIIRVGDLKTGALIGVDKYGNKYFEDPRYFFVGRQTWSRRIRQRKFVPNWYPHSLSQR